MRNGRNVVSDARVTVSGPRPGHVCNGYMTVATVSHISQKFVEKQIKLVNGPGKLHEFFEEMGTDFTIIDNDTSATDIQGAGVAIVGKLV